MNFLKTYYPSFAVIIFIVVIFIAHFAATNGYSISKNTISDLGAQGYPRKAIMQTGFLAFGVILAAGILLNGVSWRTLPVLVYAVSITLTGIFCSKPFFNSGAYSATHAALHSAFAQIAGIAFSISILTQAFFTPDKNLKLLHLLFFLVIIGLSAAFGLVKNYQGIAQRLLYIISFIWLIKFNKV